MIPESNGETISFTINFPNEDDKKYSATWNWSVSAGTIESGQGTTSIRVGTKGLDEVSITGTVTRDLGDRQWVGAQRSGDCSVLIQRIKPVLFDEFGTRGNNCEETFARLDSFFVELNNNPTDQGHIIIFQVPDSRAAAKSRQQQVRNHIRMRRFDMSRIAIRMGTVRKNATVQFWRVPSGANPPDVLPADAEFEKPEEPSRPAGEPYIYATEYTDGIPGCGGNLFDLEAYADVLRSKAGNRGNIVIGESTRSRFAAKERQIFAELKKFGIERARIRTFFRKVRVSDFDEFVELWVLPGSKR